MNLYIDLFIRSDKFKEMNQNSGIRKLREIPEFLPKIYMKKKECQ